MDDIDHNYTTKPRPASDLYKKGKLNLRLKMYLQNLYPLLYQGLYIYFILIFTGYLTQSANLIPGIINEWQSESREVVTGAFSELMILDVDSSMI